MKRLQYILLIMVVALAAACSKHTPDPSQPDSPSMSGAYIFFDQEVASDMSTKTTMVEGESLPTVAQTAFGVMGYVGSNSIFYDAQIRQSGIAKVYRNSDGADFTYQNLATWSSGSHNFYAYYPYSLEYQIGVGTTSPYVNVPYIRYTQPSDQSKMTDILTASLLNTSKVPIVNLTFQHRLWAMDITVKNNRVEKDVVYDPLTGQNKEYDPVVQVKSVKIEFDQIPGSALIYMNGEDKIQIPDPDNQSKILSFSKSYNTLHTLSSNGGSVTLNGQDSFLFLPCNSFNYRITAEFVNSLGVTYTCHHPATFEADTDGNPILADGKVQWHWATASGPDEDGNGTKDGFKAGKRYTLDIVKTDFEVEFVWKAADWGEWDGENWVPVRVEHTFI